MKKTDQDDVEQPLGRILSNAGKSFLSLVNKKLSNLDIERNFFALTLIEIGKGEINQQDLVGYLESDKVSIVRIINYLSEKGYVKRVKSKADKRKYGLHITEKAKRDLPKIKQSLSDVTKKAFEGLNNTEIETFLKTLNIIKNNLNK
jgi:MarR family transcriptional regulator, transcriptional regulator for hemolysin